MVLCCMSVTGLRLLATVQYALLRDLEGTVFDYRLELSLQRNYELVVRLTTVEQVDLLSWIPVLDLRL